jgi:hypothetical protein
MRKFLSTVLYVILGFPLAMSALFLFAARPWALDRELYKKIVTDDRLYAAVAAPELARSMPRHLEIGDGTYDGPALAAAIQKNLPAAELKRLGASAVDAALDAVESGSLRDEALDLKPLKAILADKADEVARDYVAALPVEGGERESGDFSHRSSSESMAQESAQAEKALRAALDLIPDEARPEESSHVFDALSPGRRIEGVRAMLDARGGLSQALLNRMTAVTAALSALVLAGLAALGGSGLGRRLSRAGGYVLLPSIIVLAVGTALAIPSGLVLQGLVPAEARSALGGASGAALRAYIAEVLGPIARSFFLTGLVGASVGGLLVSAKRIAEPKEIE